MAPFSPISHAVALGLLAWLHVQLRRAAPERELRVARLAVTGTLLAWIGASTTIAALGLYRSLNEQFLLLALGTAAPLVLVGLLALASGRARQVLARFAERTPLATLARVHAVRVLAIGTLYKWWLGALPGHFILPVGVPDFGVGLTALALSRRMARDPARHRGLFAAWNGLGAGTYLLAPLLIQLSQPGPLHLVHSGPTTDEVLAFPMSIVPTFVAPLLLALHVVALWRLVRDGRRQPERAPRG